MPKVYSCDFPGCYKTFKGTWYLDRHTGVHCKYEDRKYGCPFQDCKRRTTQRCGMIAHIKVHLKIRSVCPECGELCSSDAARTRHRQAEHGLGRRSGHGATTTNLSLPDGDGTSKTYKPNSNKHQAGDASPDHARACCCRACLTLTPLWGLQKWPQALRGDTRSNERTCCCVACLTLAPLWGSEGLQGDPSLRRLYFSSSFPSSDHRRRDPPQGFRLPPC